MRQIILLMILLPLLLGGCGYNTLKMQEEQVFQAWSNIKAALQRRADLIPGLAETVGEYAAHERETLQAVIEARSAAVPIDIGPGELSDSEAMNRMQEAQGNLASVLSRLLLLAQRYPGLEENQEFKDLHRQFERVEETIHSARQRYNEAVSEFNAAIREFPGNMTNTLLLRRESKEYFKVTATVREAPENAY